MPRAKRTVIRFLQAWTRVNTSILLCLKISMITFWSLRRFWPNAITTTEWILMCIASIPAKERVPHSDLYRSDFCVHTFRMIMSYMCKYMRWGTENITFGGTSRWNQQSVAWSQCPPGVWISKDEEWQALSIFHTLIICTWLLTQNLPHLDKLRRKLELNTLAVLLISSGSSSPQATSVTWVTFSTGLVKVSSTWLS